MGCPVLQRKMLHTSRSSEENEILEAHVVSTEVDLTYLSHWANILDIKYFVPTLMWQKERMFVTTFDTNIRVLSVLFFS